MNREGPDRGRDNPAENDGGPVPFSIESTENLSRFVDRLKDDLRTAFKSIDEHCRSLATLCETAEVEDCLEDIATMRKQVGKALETVNRSLSAGKVVNGETSLANLRHDLVNNLYVITEYCGELRAESDELAASADLDSIYTLGKYLDHLVSENLRESKMASVAEGEEVSTEEEDRSSFTVNDSSCQADQIYGGTSQLAGSTILVVDDEEPIRDLLRRQIEKVASGCTVLDASSSKEAFGAIEGHDVDVVLLDVMMPGTSGLEILRGLRKRYAMTRLPIIMATGRTGTEDIVEAFRLGANDYVTKPFNLPIVLSRIKTQLELKRATEEVRKKNLYIRSTFGRFLTDRVVDKLLETSEAPNFQGEKRKVTILMTDLRGFTSLSERLLPEQVVEILNLFLGTMVSVIDQFDGTVDEFIGDAILVIFGAPVWRGDDSERGVACAIAMQNAMTSINRQLKNRGLPKIEMGIGVNTGEVVVGNIGSLDRSKYGVVGRQVNLAARIESCTVGGQILVSENTRNDVGAILKVGSKAQVGAKGFEDPIVLFEVLGIGGKYNLNMPEKRDAWCDLSKELPLVCTPFEGKIAGDRVLPGFATRLSRKSLEIRIADQVAPLTNLRIQILDSDGKVLFGEVYGKVVAEKECREGIIQLHFTDISEEAIEYLRGFTAARDSTA